MIAGQLFCRVAAQRLAPFFPALRLRFNRGAAGSFAGRSPDASVKQIGGCHGWDSTLLDLATIDGSNGFWIYGSTRSPGHPSQRRSFADVIVGAPGVSLSPLGPVRPPRKGAPPAIPRGATAAVRTQTHVVSRSVGPKVSTVAPAAAMVAQSESVTRKPRVPPSGIPAGLAARRCHMTATPARCTRITMASPRRSGAAGQPKAQPMAWRA